MNRRLMVFFLFLALALVMAVLFAISVDKQDLLNFVIHKSYDIKSHINEWPILSVISYILVYILLVALSLPGLFMLTILGGATFGWLGLAYTSIGATLGSTLAFYLTRTWFRDSVLRQRKRRLRQFSFLITKHGASVLIALRLFTLIPYYMVNLVSALTSVSTQKFLLTTFVGMLPVHAVFINAGTHIANVKKIEDIWSPEMIVAFALLGVLPLTTILLKKTKLSGRQVAASS